MMLEKQNQIQNINNSCKKCNKQIELNLGSAAYSVICSSCGAIHNSYGNNLVITNKTVDTPVKAIDIPIGTKGTIKGIPYQVIGYIYKKENGTIYYWHEYVLFNPVHGIAYLSQYDGHWMLLFEMDTVPSVNQRVAIHDGTIYDLYSKYKSKIVRAKGEFIYRFDVSEMPVIEEFICPGFLISRETTADTVTWYKGEYIESTVIKDTFSLASVPLTKGVGMIQPFIGKFTSEALRKVSIFLVILWGLMQFYFMFASKSEIAFEQSFYIDDSLNSKEIHSKVFELKYGTCNAEIKINTNVDNNWFYANATLVNEQTGDVYDVGLEAEYYHGYTGGENWSEGSNWVSKVVSQVPEGKYYMILTPEKPLNLPVVSITVSVIRDVFILSNGLIVLLLLAIFPVYYFYRKNQFEKKRWYNSNYSPYDDDQDY